MDTSVLLLTVLCGSLIAYIIWNHEKNKPGIHRVLTEPMTPGPLTESSMETASTTEAPMTATSKKPFVVRVSGILPEDGDASQVKSWVKTTIAEISNDESDYISDITIVPSCTDTENLVAIVDFKILPEFLSSLKGGLSKSCQVPGRNNYFLHFDAEFLSFTQMYSTEAKPTADIVFISGIGSHAYGSWTSKTDPWRMWPRHFLPNYFPNVRVMIYGHKAKLTGTGFGELLDYSRSFGDALKQARKKDPERPIVFIAHSFGGNILKSFLVKDQQSSSLILSSTRGILFFAVPHRGMDVEDMVAAIQYKDTAEKRLGQISEESYWHQELDNFVNIIKGYGVASFYETELTRRLIMKPNGSFARVGEHTWALDPHSATLDLPRDMESKHPVDADHSAIVKFESETFPAFTQALDCLNEYLTASKHTLDEATWQCLLDLRLTDPRDDMKTIQIRKDKLLEESSNWILSNPEYIQWRDHSNKRLLWIKGDPGKGKTMIMMALINDLEQRLSTSQDIQTLSYFFCIGTDQNLNNAVAVLRGLIYLLVLQQPPLVRHIQDRYKTAGKQLFADTNTFSALYNIFKSMIQDPKFSNAYLLIDALDECQSGLPELLDLITSTFNSSPRVKWLVSSRNKNNIEARLPETQDMKISLELNAKSVLNAVNLYIDFKVSELAVLNNYKDDTEVQAKVRDHLRENSEGTFLWVALVCKQLENVPSWEILDAVKEFPSGLQPLYTLMMEQVDHHPRPKTAEFCRSILSAVTVVFRPLHLKELVSIAGLPAKSFQDTKMLANLIDTCGSFLTVRENVVYFVHQSAKDYFSTGDGLRVFSAGLHGEHRLVVDRSLLTMSGILERNMCKLKHPGSQVRMATVDNRIKAIRYICCFWFDHLIKYLNSSSIDSKYLQDGGPVHHFLLKHLLHWFEALSLFGEFNRGVPALHGLKKMLRARVAQSQPEITPRLDDFVHDALRIFLRCRIAVEKAPLQVYNAGLLFAPSSSVVKRHFIKEIPDWIQIIPQIQNHWSPCLQTLEGHTSYIWSAVFSPDGQQIASASGDHTIRLWDTTTGAALQTLEGHTNSVWSVAFSPDGQQLASASGDHTIRLWNAMTGALLHILEGRDSFNSVTFSPDSQQLASGSNDCIVRLWNATTGTILRMLKGHTSFVNSVAFAPDGQQLASASDDCTVRLWDTTTSATIQTLNGHNSGVRSVAFSPNGQQLASASDDSTIRLWNVTTGATLQTLKAHTGFTSVAFSPNGQQLASTLDGRMVRLWDATTGSVLQTLEGHTNFVNSVAFSPDGQQLASGSWDTTVRIWDATTDSTLQTSERHTGWVISVAFSPNGQQLALALDDNTVRLWDAMTGATLQKLKGHTSRIWSVAFSSNGQQLASVAEDKTVRLWDTTTGAALQMFEGDTEGTNGVRAFSNDGRKLITSVGVFNLSQPSPKSSQDPSGTGYNIDSDRKWITWNNEKILWLPPDYRPAESAVRKHRIAVGYRSGKICFLKFRPGVSPLDKN